MPKVMPTEKMKAVGIGGVAAIVGMGLVDQLLPGTIDWSESVMGVPLGAAVVFAASWAAGWFKREGKS